MRVSYIVVIVVAAWFIARSLTRAGNIEGMPVYRDAMGGIGTPTSDNERTKLEAGTTHLLTIINGYSGKEGLQEAADYMLELLKEFAASKDEELIYF